MSTTETDKEQKPDWKLRAAGTGYIVGDASMVAAAVTRSGMQELGGSLSAGAIWLAGGAAAALYGNPNKEKQLQIIGSKLESYLQKKGVTIPDDARGQNKLLKKKSLWQQIEQFMYEHPSEMLNAGYAIGAALLLHQGRNELISMNPATKRTLFMKNFSWNAFEKVSSNFWMGMCVLPGALIGMFAKEDPQAMKKAEHGNIFEKAMAWITESPLRISSALYALNNVFLFGKLRQDYTARNTLHAGKALKPHIFSGLTLGVYLISNALLFMSPRNQISNKGFDEKSIAQLEDAAARIIAAQPAEAQEKLLTDVSKHMAAQKGIKIDAPTFAKHLADRVGALTGEKLKASVNDTTWATREATREQAPQGEHHL